MAYIDESNGIRTWYNANGERHRDNDLPAIEDENGDKYWWKNGKIHRDNDLPAIEYADGDKLWFMNGKNHRENGLPAIESTDGAKQWHVNGQYHRLGGLPAIEYTDDGSKKWYIYDKNYTYDQVCNYYQTLARFGRYCLKKIRLQRLKRTKWIHGELLCMPAKGNFSGGQEYHEMVNYFMIMQKI